MYASGPCCQEEEDGLGIAPVIVGAAISAGSKLITKLTGGRTGEEVAADICKVLVKNATAAALAGDVNALHYMGTKAGILPPYMATTTFNYYDKSNKDYNDYQGRPGMEIGNSLHPGCAAVMVSGYNAAVTKLNAVAASKPTSPAVAVLANTAGGSFQQDQSAAGTPMAMAGISPMLIVIGIGSAVMLSSLFKRR